MIRGNVSRIRKGTPKSIAQRRLADIEWLPYVGSIADVPHTTIDDPMPQGLRTGAAADDRSISQQTVHVMRAYLSMRKRKQSDPLESVVAIFDEQAEAANIDPWAERIAYRKALFDEMDELPLLDVPKGFPDSADLVREMREERMAAVEPKRSSAL